MNKQKEQISVERFNPDIKLGLSDEQVKTRIEQKLTNKTKMVVGKSYAEIIFNDVFNLFNILLFSIAALMIYGQYYSGLFFLVVLIPNIGISLYQDLKARHLMGKLRLLTAPKATVIRNGKEVVIDSSEIVLDDIVLIKGDKQISMDGIILNGNIAVNESLLTGESDNIYKKEGDKIYSGSFSISGEAYVKADKVGSESYIETLQSKAKKFKRSASEILKSLRRMFAFITAIVIFFLIAMLVTYGLQGKFNNEKSFKEIIGPVSGSLVGMIPSGLYLLTSVALAVGVIALYQKKTLVQDFYSLEMLARTDILCVDKTGTITDGNMKFKSLHLLTNEYDEGQMKQIVSNILWATNDDNLTAKALKEGFNFELSVGINVALPFNSENKYSGASFKNRGSFYLGALEYLKPKNSVFAASKIKEYTQKGYRVLVIAKGDLLIADNKAQGELSAIGFIVLMDNIRPSAIKTFKWFNENNVQVKVISGDNSETVSEIARQAGINEAYKSISLEGMSDEEVRKIANEYNVFGRVSPEQKQILIESMHNNGHTVAMTGDGVNDILALKKADCSIAMATGSEAARNVSHLVLLDSNFDRLPSVVSEGRRVVNNLQRTSSLFLCKTFFAMAFTLIFLLASIVGKNADITYPFKTNNLYLWEDLGIGISAFFLALEPDDTKIEKGFLKNILKKALPGGILMILSTITFFILFVLEKNNLINLDLKDYSKVISMATISLSLVCMVILYRVCKPLDKYRKIVFSSALILDLLILIGFYFSDNYWFKNKQFGLSLLNVDFFKLSGVNYFTTLIIAIIFSSLYIFIFYINDIFKEKKAR